MKLGVKLCRLSFNKTPRLYGWECDALSTEDTDAESLINELEFLLNHTWLNFDSNQTWLNFDVSMEIISFIHGDSVVRHSCAICDTHLFVEKNYFPVMEFTNEYDNCCCAECGYYHHQDICGQSQTSNVVNLRHRLDHYMEWRKCLACDAMYCFGCSNVGTIKTFGDVMIYAEYGCKYCFVIPRKKSKGDRT